MRDIIIGTAGHIDHGKTQLIYRLTGKNTDRLPEEKKRGMTIDLGFAQFHFSDGLTGGIIDVPGHEHFIPNMLAGASSMDLVLLVIDIAEGVMPQTREHMWIIQLLEISKCIVVLNKCDKIPSDQWSTRKESIQQELKRDGFVPDDYVLVSAKTGWGMDELIKIMKLTAQAISIPKKGNTIGRMFIDRIFTVSGSGTVVTGTMRSGSFQKNEVITIYPDKIECRIRSIQIHEKEANTCSFGQRVALNLPDLSKEQLKRGFTVATYDSMKPVDLLTVQLTLLKECKRSIKNQTNLHLYIGTERTLCKVVLLGTKQLQAGESAYAQLFTQKKLTAKEKDRFIVRFASPEETIGGGIVLDGTPKRIKPNDDCAIKRLDLLLEGKETLLHYKLREQWWLKPVREYERLLAITADEWKNWMESFHQQGNEVLLIEGLTSYIWLLQAEKEFDLRLRLLFDKKRECRPYLRGIRRTDVVEEFRHEIEEGAVLAAFSNFIHQGTWKISDEYAYPKEYQVPRGSTFLKVHAAVKKALEKAEYTFMPLSSIPIREDRRKHLTDIVEILTTEGEFVHLSGDLYTLPQYAITAWEIINKAKVEAGNITIREIKQKLPVSRKNAAILLEWYEKHQR